MSRRPLSSAIGVFERQHMRHMASLPAPTPTPPPPAVAPISGRLPALGDEVEVVVHVAVLAARTRRMDTVWVKDRVSELRYQQAAPGFTTADRGAQPRLSEEGVRWRWPAPPNL